MPQVHPTAILDGDITLADDVTIGPWCHLTGPITIGPGTHLIGNVYIHGPATIGANNRMYPFACLGFSGQDLKWDVSRPGAGIVVGDGNTFREHVTIHRATRDEQPSRIGDHNFWMASSHGGHDLQFGSNSIVANATLFAGEVEVGDNVITGGNSGVHQFCRVGRGSFLAGGKVTSKDIPPFFMLTGTNCAGSINIIGMRRRGIPRDQIDDVQWVFRTLYRKGHALRTAVDLIRERAADRPMVKEMLDFIESSKRGITEGTVDPRRG